MAGSQTRRPQQTRQVRAAAAATVAAAAALVSISSCSAFTVVQSSLALRLAPAKSSLRRTQRTAQQAGNSSGLSALSALVIGAGPSGLLLAHRLLKAGAKVEIIEGRSDPREEGSKEGRAYALGLGIRARTAIRSVDRPLWEAVTPSGFESARFKLHIGGNVIDLRTPEDNVGLEPSVLIYQSDLCSALLGELDTRHGASGRLGTHFRTRAMAIDPINGTVEVEGEDGTRRTIGPVDLIAGCDGVNSVARAALETGCKGFQAEKVPLPGNLKVIRLPAMPKALDPTAVHALPGKGGASAFVEPTAQGCCVLVTWRDAPPVADPAAPKAVDLGAVQDPQEAETQLKEFFPMLADQINLEAGRQFVSQSSSRAATVRCNTYNFGKLVLLGDAAHSTGGVSGQGCNSALQDAEVLSDKLEEANGDVQRALSSYSQTRVPEGHALLELSLGPSAEVAGWQKALYGASQLVDALLFRFGIGKPPLQVQLTTSMRSFAELRRDRNFFFGDFPSDAEYAAKLERIGA